MDISIMYVGCLITEVTGAAQVSLVNSLIGGAEANTKPPNVSHHRARRAALSVS